MDRQCAPIRDWLRKLFKEDACETVREMTEKCGRFFAAENGKASVFGMGMWRDLQDLARKGRELLIVR